MLFGVNTAIQTECYSAVTELFSFVLECVNIEIHRSEVSAVVLPPPQY